MEKVITIPALGDNFIYVCIYDDGKAFAIDPAQPQGVIAALAVNNLTLTHILLTHHHYDHTGGVNKLKDKTNCQVFAPDTAGFPDVDTIVKEGQTLTFGADQLQVIATPGHTATSVCYYIRPAAPDETGVLFTGDTLFIAGCGRILETNAETMFDSLMKLVSLPDETLIYPGHDYTVENLQFALTVDPDNIDAQKLLRSLIKNRTVALPGPSTIAQEKLTNPFLRAETQSIRNKLKMNDAPTAEVFAELRKRKDVF